MAKKLNRYVRRKRDKKLDFIKGCHRKNFRLERYTHINSKWKLEDGGIKTDLLIETNYRYKYKDCYDYFKGYFNLRYVKEWYLEYPKYKYSLYGDRHIKHSVKVQNSSYEEYHVKNYDYYRSIQKREWNKTNCHNKMELMSRGRERVHSYLKNIEKEYNSGHDELTDDKLSGKIELFDKYDWRY